MPAHRVSAKNRTSVMNLSKEAWDTGQTVILPHSLKLDASMEQTFSKASRLSMSDLSTAGAAAGGALDEGTSFFPLSFFVGTMAMERGNNSRWIGGGTQRLEEEKRTRSVQAAKGE